MSRLNGRYHGKFMEDYTDYDIDYYSSMEGMGDNFDYMNKVSKEHYIDNSFDYDKRAWAHQDTRDHHISHQAQRQHDLPRQPSRWSHRHEKHSKAHDRHHQSHHEHPQQDQEQPRQVAHQPQGQPHHGALPTVNQDRHQANQNQDEEPQDPWLENFNARRAAWEKKFDAMDKKYADRYAYIKAKYTTRMEESHSTLTTTREVLQATQAKLTAIMEQLMSTVNNLARQRHRSRSHSSRSSSRYNHGSHHERHRQPHPQEHGANQQHHLDSLCERKKPTPCKDESHIHIESKSDTPHELSEDILLSNNLTSTPLGGHE
jgi:hypothetical protein